MNHSKEDIGIVKGNLDLDESTIQLLSKYYKDDKLEEVKHHMAVILDLINTNTNRYNFSKDYKDAIDHVIGLIIAGKFLKA